jgi:hypothetical protein
MSVGRTSLALTLVTASAATAEVGRPVASLTSHSISHACLTSGTRALRARRVPRGAGGVPIVPGVGLASGGRCLGPGQCVECGLQPGLVVPDGEHDARPSALQVLGIHTVGVEAHAEGYVECCGATPPTAPRGARSKVRR